MQRKHFFFLLTLFLAASFLFAACTPAAQPTAGPVVATEAPAGPTEAPVEPTQAPEPTATTEPTPEPEPTEEPAPEPIEMTDGLGRTVTLAGPAQRIISLAPSNTEILFAIGAGGQVVGRDTFSDFPAEALDVADIGGGFGELDIEIILALEPDLVLAADITPPEQVAALEELGLTVFALANPNDLEGMFGNLLIAARLTGHETEAETLAAELAARVDAVRKKVAAVEERPLVFYQLDSSDVNAPWTAGPGNFIDSLIDMAGGVNVGGVLDSPWAQISVEELIAQNPDVIIVGDFTWGGVTAEDVLARPGWEGIAAVQTGQVFEFDDNLVSRPGPRMVDGLEAMARLLHPDLFE